MTTGRLSSRAAMIFASVAAPPARLADEHIDRVTLEMVPLFGEGERPASDEDLVETQRQALTRWIDEANQKAYVGRGAEGRDLAGADGEPGAPPNPTDNRSGRFHAVDLDPAVERGGGARAGAAA